MNMDDLRKANLERLPILHKTCKKWSLMEWACAAAGEMGECCNAIKKEERDGVDNSQQIQDEIADIIIYLDIIAGLKGFKLTDAIRHKFNKTSLKYNSSIMI